MAAEEAELEREPSQPLLPEDFECRLQAFMEVTAGMDTEVLKAKVKEERKAKSTEELNLDDNKALTYSEMDMQTLETLLSKIKSDFGPIYNGKGVFLDLGSGSGKACIAAGLLHQFEKVVGIDYFECLTAAGNAALPKYQEAQLPEGTVKPEIQLIKGDFVADFDALLEPLLPQLKVVLAVATCFGDAEMAALSKLATKMPHDSFLITFSKSLPEALLIDENRNPKQRRAVAVKKALCVRGREPESVEIVVAPPDNNPHGWKELHSELVQMSWGPSTCFIFKKTFAAILLDTKWEYKEGKQEEVDQLLKKLHDYYKSIGEFGTILTTFNHKHVEGGYTVVEAFPSGAAHEQHCANTYACPFMAEVMTLQDMVVQKEVIIYGLENEVTDAPSLKEYYPNGIRKEKRPDLNMWGVPFFGWSA